MIQITEIIGLENYKEAAGKLAMCYNTDGEKI
jgi:hypothetical protein